MRAYPEIAIAWDRLAEFLGGDFEPALTDYGACCRFVDAEFARLGADIYRSGVGYLYELTHFHFSPHKDAFFEVVTTFAEESGLRSIADVGCGVALDAQVLLGAGCDVALYDFDSPSTRYATWRLTRDMGARHVVRAFDQLPYGRHDLVYAVDVLEHALEPAALVADLFAAGRHVCVNLFEHDPSPWDGKDMHYPLNHRRLIPVFSQYGDLLQVGISGDTVVTLWRRR